MTKGESCLVMNNLNLKRGKTFKFSIGVSISKAFRLLTATGNLQMFKEDENTYKSSE